MKKAFLFSFGLIVAFSSLFVSCGEDYPQFGTSTCCVSLSVNGDGYVCFENYPGSSVSVSYGLLVTVVATPSEESCFVGWYDNGIQVSTDLNYMFTVYNNLNLVAKFVKSDLVPIRFDIGSGRVSIQQKSAATRGTGAVGDVATSNNTWNGEELKVYMFNKGTLDLALDKTNDNLPLFDNVSIIATPGASVVEPATPKYYPMQGNFDFFAYHVDDAAAGQDVVVGADAYTLPVTIDGTQDLMVAKAGLKEGQERLLGGKPNDYYSAYSARKEVNPHFTFQHLLSRLVFKVKAATESEKSVVITDIEVTNANTTANMVVAYTETPEEFLTDIDTPASVFLKDRNAAELADVNPSAAYNTVGESMLLMPQAEYNMIVHMTHDLGDGPRNVSYEYTLKAEQLNLASFEAGKQYNVNFTVYGLSEIVLEFELTVWEEGRDLGVDDNEISPTL